MVKTEKCRECRLAKQKCLPEKRTWDSNEKQKCANCLKGNRSCGPNENPPDRPPRRRGPRVQQDKYGGGEAPPEDSKITRKDYGSTLGSPSVTGAYTSDNSKELRDRLKDLDADAELANQVEITIEQMENRVLGYNMPNYCPEFFKLVELRHATSQNLLSKLSVVEALGDRARNAGEMELAEIAYTRVLDIYRRQPSPVASFIRPLLMKMASFYWNTDQPLRAEKCWWDIFKLRDSNGKTHYIEKEVWQELAKSLSQTSGIITQAFRSCHPDLFSALDLKTPFTPVHAMIKSEYASDTSYTKFGTESSSDISVSPSIHTAISGDVGNLSEIIRKVPETDLAARDILHREPLFLAAFLKQEAAGHDLLLRISRLPPVIQSQRLNSRDVSGQTILGVATLSGCSKKFIKALIEHGAAIDPVELLKYPLTPLQAACMIGRLEIVELFLGHDAAIDRVFEGNPTPAELAQTFEHDEIVQLIAKKTQSPYSSSANLSTQHHSLTNIDTTQIVSGDCPLPTHATMIYPLQDDDYNSTDTLLSYINAVSKDQLDDHEENCIMSDLKDTY